MRILPFAIILLFYFFAILQNSFFIHFNFFGTVPNLILIFLFLLLFFGAKKVSIDVILYSIVAGLLLDIFSSTFLGFSAIAFIIIGYLTKKIQGSLREQESKHPFVYFLPLFILFFIIYELFFIIYAHFANPSHMPINFDLKFLANIIYNSFFASAGFLIFKKFLSNV